MVTIEFYDKKDCTACKIMKNIIKDILNNFDGGELSVNSHSAIRGSTPVEEGMSKPVYPTIVIRSQFDKDMVVGTCTKHFLECIINKHIALERNDDARKS